MSLLISEPILILMASNASALEKISVRCRCCGASVATIMKTDPLAWKNKDSLATSLSLNERPNRKQLAVTTELIQ